MRPTTVSLAARAGRALLLAVAGVVTVSAAATAQTPLPAGIQSVIDRPLYDGAVWGIRAVDLATGETVMSYGPDSLFYTGSVRKLFSVGVLLNAVGPDHTYDTPVYRTGEVIDGILDGDLVVVASGDLTLGGRTNADGTVAFTSFDHTEANSLGSAILTEPDPLAGIDELARQIAAAGITSVTGDVVIDDRLFEHFRVPNGNVLITPVIVNDNFVDVTIVPGAAGEPAKIDYRPQSVAFTVKADVATTEAGTEANITLAIDPNDPTVGIVSGTIPADYRPSLPGVPTLVQTFPIADPSAYMRSVLIEALGRAGVAVNSAATGPNPLEKLPAKGSYSVDAEVARLVPPPYAQYANLILKVSLNLGANLSLALYGVSQGATALPAMLAAERAALVDTYKVPGDGFNFPTNGSGSPDSQATPAALMQLLTAMQETPNAGIYFDALPSLGVDGSLASVGVDPPNPAIAPAIGKVFAKTGTTITGDTLRAQVFAGYIETKAGKKLAYVVYVNNVSPITSIADVINVFAAEGEISAEIYQAH